MVIDFSEPEIIMVTVCSTCTVVPVKIFIGYAFLIFGFEDFQLVFKITLVYSPGAYGAGSFNTEYLIVINKFS